MAFGAISHPRNKCAMQARNDLFALDIGLVIDIGIGLVRNCNIDIYNSYYTDLRFVKKFTRPNFRAKNFTQERGKICNTRKFTCLRFSFLLDC